MFDAKGRVRRGQRRRTLACLEGTTTNAEHATEHGVETGIWRFCVVGILPLAYGSCFAQSIDIIWIISRLGSNQ